MRYTILALAFVATPLYAQTNSSCILVGNTVNCTSFSREDREARQQQAQQRANAKALGECLRKSDWPGAPDRAECQRLYGGN